MIWILIIPLAVLVLWVLGTYNFFVSSKARVKASIQEIGNQLKRQADLIPNLESSVKGYMSHEKEVFKMLTDARKQVIEAANSNNLQKMSDAGAKLNEVLPQIRVAVESNPELKANTVVGNLMDELRDTADKVMYARRLMIDLTADYNVKLVSFPSNLVANLFHFEELSGLTTSSTGAHMEVQDEEMKTPKVNI